MSLVAQGVGYSVGGRSLLEGLDLRLEPGRVHAVIGPNGAGKSTLLRLLAGEWRPSTGAIELNGRPLSSWSARDRARQRAVLPQAHALGFGFSAAQVVELGRLPCPRHRPEIEAEIVGAALRLAGVAPLAHRAYPTLSGGERARVQFARAAAQVWEPLDGALRDACRFLLLDEPTASLDLAHQHDCLRSVRTLAARGIGVLAVLHDPNLALRYADDVSLIRDGRVLASGLPGEAITADSLERLYRIPVRLVTVEGEPCPLVVARASGEYRR